MNVKEVAAIYSEARGARAVWSLTDVAKASAKEWAEHALRFFELFVERARALERAMPRC